MRWWKRPADHELTRELQFHLDELIEEKIAEGIPPDEARRQAALEFGGKQQLQEELRDIRHFAFVEKLLTNFLYALRSLRKSPSFSAAVIVTLALGIGANTAVFSAIDAVLLKPLPYPNSDRLMVLHEYKRKLKTPESPVAPVRLEDWNRLNSTFQAISGYYEDDATDVSGALPEKITMALVAPRFLEVLGVSPALGRDFTTEEERFGGPAAILISNRYWRTRFHADPTIIGRQVRLGNSSYLVAGVMPASFHFPDRNVSVWLPVPLNAPYTQDRRNTWYTAIGRLKPNTTPAQAKADLATVQRRLGMQYPSTDADMTVEIQPLKDITIGGVRRSLWILFGSVSVLLLIACINVGALLLARASQRLPEISVRLALGASRVAVMSQLLTESFILAACGAAVGLLVVAASVKAFHLLAKDLPRVQSITIDWRILLYTLGCALVVSLTCGFFPALHATHRSIAGVLAHHGRTQVSARNRFEWVLVGAQVALAVMLLVGAGLLLRSFQALGKVSPGFDPSHILTFHVTGNYGETADWKKLQARIRRTLDELRTLPGVQADATAVFLPGTFDKYQAEFIARDAGADPARKINADNRMVSAGYFATMRIPVLAGVACQEDWQGLNVVVNRSFANTYFQGSALGHHLSFPSFLPNNKPSEIRGIVGDAREEGLTQEPVPTVYTCWNAPGPDPNYLVRTSGDPLAMAHAIRMKLHEIEPSRSMFDVMTLEQHIGDSFAQTRLRTVLLTFFAATALLLACVGLYGTLSYFVTTRQREVGLRLALGATPGDIIEHFLFRGLTTALLGSIAGLCLAWAFTRVLAGMLYGVSQTDAVTFSSVALVLLAVAGIASFIPALRASHIDPMQVLREE